MLIKILEKCCASVSCHQSTHKFCEAVQEATRLSLHVTTNLLASFENATQAALAASSVDHEKATAIVLNG